MSIVPAPSSPGEGTLHVTATRFKHRARLHFRCDRCGAYGDNYVPLEDLDYWADYLMGATRCPLHFGGGH